MNHNGGGVEYPTIGLDNETEIIHVKEQPKTVFYIDNVEYNFQEGMTFEQWLSSEYDTLTSERGFIINENGTIDLHDSEKTVPTDEFNLLMLNNNFVLSSDKIQKDIHYWAFEPTDPIEFTIIELHEGEGFSSEIEKVPVLHKTNRGITWETFVNQSCINIGIGCGDLCIHVNYINNNIYTEYAPGCVGAGFLLITKDGVNVLPTDIIIEGSTYESTVG